MQSGKNCVHNKCTVQFKRTQKVGEDEVEKTGNGQKTEGVT